MMVIFYMSQRNGVESSGMSNGLLGIVATLLRVKDVENFILKYGFFIRKLAHFTEYFILGFLTYINLIEYKETKKAAIIQSIVLCILYASGDEIHQGFVDGRFPGIFDVFIDSCGSISGIGITHLMNVLCYHEKKR